MISPGERAFSPDDIPSCNKKNKKIEKIKNRKNTGERAFSPDDIPPWCWISRDVGAARLHLHRAGNKKIKNRRKNKNRKK